MRIDIDMDPVNVIIPSEKGSIAAAIHRPKMQTDLLAVLCPGYLDSKDYEHLVRLAEALSSRGYTAVRFDPTGTWGSGGDISDYTTTQYLKDVGDVLRYLRGERAYATTLLCGHSRGGTISILRAANDLTISGVLAIMPSADRDASGRKRAAWARSGVRISKRDFPEDEKQVKVFRVPYAHLQDRDRYDVFTAAAKIRVPIIFAAGALDEVILPSEVKEIYDHANEPEQFVLLAGIGHDYRHNEEEIRTVNGLLMTELRKMAF